MKVELRDITAGNFDDVANLHVDEDQQGYVASNLYSIAEAQFNPSYRPRAIYYRGHPAGFIMYESVELDDEQYEYSIFRFMVDHRYQGKGIGRRAMDLVLEEIRASGSVECISICYVPSNPVARDFYASFGFRETGLDAAGREMIAEIRG